MVCEMNTIGESAYWPGVARLRLGLKLGEEPTLNVYEVFYIGKGEFVCLFNPPAEQYG